MSLDAADNKVTIRPYIDPSNDNMGLPQYNQTVFANVFHEEPITCLEQYGIRRYVTGLDEFAPEVDSIGNPDEKAAKIKDIRKTVAYLEQRLGGATLDVEDKDFWSKVQILRPNNDAFWGQIKMVVGNDPIYLEPGKDPHDLIKLRAIEAGGFSIICPSLEQARRATKTPKFYLDKLKDTLSLTTELKKLRNKAGALLEKLYEKDYNKLFYVAKVIDANSVQYRRSTAKDVLYNNMDLFLEGELDGNRSKRKNAEKFIEICGKDMETLKIRSVIKDATFARLIALRGDGGIYDMASSSLMGKTVEEVVEYMKNPLNDKLAAELISRVEETWGK